jgi:ketosteroid isomerase-like protein
MSGGDPAHPTNLDLRVDYAELARHIWERFAPTGREIDDDELDAFVAEFFAPEIVFDMTNFEGWPEAQIYAGRRAAREHIARWHAAFDHLEMSVERIVARGERVVSIITQRGYLAGSDTPVEMRYGALATFRGRQAVRNDFYSDPDQALAALGEKR